MALPGFPNFFMLMGPHSPVGNYSLTAIAEAQEPHPRLDPALAHRRIRASRLASGHRRIQREHAPRHAGHGVGNRLHQLVLGADGLPELWPWTPREYRRRLAAAPDINDYETDTSKSTLRSGGKSSA